MDLGTKPSKMYDAPSSNKKYYPGVSLPASLFEGTYKPGDTCVIEFKGRIESMGKDNYYVELIEGKEVESAATEKKEESLLKKATAK